MSFSAKVKEDDPQPAPLVATLGPLNPYVPHPTGPRHCIAIDDAPPEKPESQETKPILRIDALSEIATLMRSLTYGEMIELAAAIWKMKPDDGELNDETLPETLHRWSKSHAN